MEVDGYSAKSECYGAFERRRETSTMEEFKGAMKRMDEETSTRILEKIDEMIRMLGMRMNQNQSSTVVRVKVKREEKAAIIIQAFLRTTLVRM